VLTIGIDGRRALAAAVLGVAAVSVALGVLQIIGGVESPLRFYAVTNPKSAVGFFANRNHQADFLAVTLPLAAYLASRWAGRGKSRGIFWGAAAAAYALVVAVGAAVTGSRAGVLLVLLGGAGAVVVAVRTRSRSPGGRWRFASLAAPAALLLLGAGIVAIAVDAPLRDAVQARAGPDLRFSLNPQVAQAGAVFAPFGSGAGSFSTVYQMFEPVGELGPAFVNHAHDDFVETWLEAGWAGVFLIAGFLAWWVTASWKRMVDRRGRGAALSLAGSMIVGMMLIHSLVDYPLRTPALAALFALACGLIVEPPTQGGQET
jgi:O-antigen ligase